MMREEFVPEEGQADKAPGITEEIDQAVESLEKQVAAMAELLGPVSRNEPREHTSDSQISPVVSPMRNNLNRIIAATSRLVALRQDCEL